MKEEAEYGHGWILLYGAASLICCALVGCCAVVRGSCSRTIGLSVVSQGTQVQHVVASDQELSQGARLCHALNEFDGVLQLDIHVRVYRHEEPAVLHAPFQLHCNFLSCQLLQEWLWMDDALEVVDSRTNKPTRVPNKQTNEQK